MNREDVAEAVRLLDGLLAAVEGGMLSADGPAGAALTRQMQGAALALSLLAQQADLPDLPDVAPERGERSS